MARAAQLDVEFTTSGIEKVNRAADSVNLKLGAIGAGLMMAGAQWTDKVTRPVMGFLQDAYMGAASLEQAMGKVEAVYGDAADEVIRWSEGSAQGFGTSQQAALDMAGTYAAIMQAQGMSIEQSAEYSQSLVELAADMSAFTDISIDRSQLALRAAITGEYESLKAFGVVLKASEVELEAMNIALEEGTEEITEQHRQLARYRLIMRQTTTMHGQFAREADGASGSLAILNAQWKDMGAQIGNILLPIGTRLTLMLSSVVDWLGKLPTPITATVVGLAALAAVVGPLLSLTGMMFIGLAALPGAFAAIGAAITPLLPVIAALTVAVGALFLAYETNFLGFGDMVDSAIDRMERFFSLPDSKDFSVTTTFDGNQHYIEAVTLPDGTKEWIIKEKDGSEFGKVISSYTDPEDPNYAYITIEPTDGDEPFQTRVNLLTSELDTVEIEVTLDTGPAISEWEAMKWKFENDGLFGTVNEGFLTMLQAVSDSFGGWLNDQGERFRLGGIELIDSLHQGAMDGWETASAWFGALASSILDAVGETSSTLAERGTQLMLGFFTAVTTYWPTARQWFINLPTMIFNAIGSMIPTLTQRGTELLTGFYTAVTTYWPTPRQWFINLGTMIFNAIGSLAKTLWDRGTEVLTGFYSAVVDKWSIGGVRGWFVDLASKIVGAVGDLGGALWNAGSAVMQGLWDGMKSKWDQVTGWLSSLNPANFKGPEARDKKMLYQPGIWIMEGLGRGLEEGWQDVTRQLGGYTLGIASAGTLTPSRSMALPVSPVGSLNNRGFGAAQVIDQTTHNEYFISLNDEQFASLLAARDKANAVHSHLSGNKNRTGFERGVR